MGRPGRPRTPVDLVEVIGRRWAGQSFPAIARGMRIGYGTVVRAYHTATLALQAVQNPRAAKLRTVTDDESRADAAEVDRCSQGAPS
jgi:hypothetical protein